MKLMDYYDDAVKRDDIKLDPLQTEVITHLQRVMDEVSRPSGWFWHAKRLTGLYLYGPVGVGKTYLMDLFYEHLPEPRKARFHFHQFMQQIDAALRQLQGKKDPLRHVAADLARTVRVLCLDEFLVEDVAVAMILAELLQALWVNDIVLVITSNTRPDDLYLNGVQRERFVPAIDLINKHCEAWVLTESRDYRLGRVPALKAYLFPNNRITNKLLVEQYNMISKGEVTTPLEIQRRVIEYVKCSSNTVWFKFNVICNIPRSQLDYLEIAARFDTLFVSETPTLGVDDTQLVVLFIRFVDVMYDQGIRLVLQAAVALEKLYIEGPMLTSFGRTLSRLMEMQSDDYWRRHVRR